MRYHSEHLLTGTYSTQYRKKGRRKRRRIRKGKKKENKTGNSGDNKENKQEEKGRKELVKENKGKQEHYVSFSTQNNTEHKKYNELRSFPFSVTYQLAILQRTFMNTFKITH